MVYILLEIVGWFRCYWKPSQVGGLWMIYILLEIFKVDDHPVCFYSSDD